MEAQARKRNRPEPLWKDNDLSDDEIVSVRKEIAAEVMFNFSLSMWHQYVKPILAVRRDDKLAHLEELLEHLGKAVLALEE